MTMDIGTLMQDLAFRVLAGLLAPVILTIGGYFFSERFRSYSRRIWHFTFDTKVQAELSRVDCYDQSPINKLDMGIFSEIQAVSDSVTFDAMAGNGNMLRIKGENLPTPLEIKIEEQPNFEQDLPDTPRYEVRIGTYTDMVFGYRSNSPLKEFEALSEEISKTVQRNCFQNKEKQQSFLLGKVKGTLPMETDRIEDSKLKMKAKVRDKTINMTFEDPRYLTEGIRKYFQPI